LPAVVLTGPAVVGRDTGEVESGITQDVVPPEPAGGQRGALAAGLGVAAMVVIALVILLLKGCPPGPPPVPPDGGKGDLPRDVTPVVEDTDGGDADANDGDALETIEETDAGDVDAPDVDTKPDGPPPPRLQCSRPRGSLEWCKGCPDEVNKLEPPDETACKCGKLNGTYRPSDSNYCKCFPDDKKCPKPPPGPCDAPRLSLDWCTKCSESDKLASFSPDDCTCRKVTKTMRPGDKDWVRCYGADPCEAPRRSESWCKSCQESKKLPEFGPDDCACGKLTGRYKRGSDAYCKCFPGDAACGG